MTAYTIAIKTNYKRMYDAVNCCTEHAIAFSNDYISCTDLQEIQDVIDVTDSNAKIIILDESEM